MECDIQVMERLSLKEFKNEFVKSFEGDDTGDLRPRQTPRVLYSKAIPTPVSNPVLLAWSDDLAKDLGIASPDEKDVNVLGGNLVTSSMYPYATCYGGHQFGNWAGQLGDGRAITLGEWQTTGGETWELQLKGAGQTPYSRSADGRAVLRSSVREYLMSEAMHYLGVPTTRALSLVSTGDPVLRDMFYNGHPAYEPGAIVMRVSPSFIRFGNFQLLWDRNEIDNLRKLTDWTIEKYYPHITGDNKVVDWFKEVVERTAHLIVEWLRVGFVHGVMNTDNMSILGLTIDYGPYSFLDDYNPGFTPNTTDLPGRRYAFGRQAAVAFWNLARLADAITPLIQNRKELEDALESYKEIFSMKYYHMMGNKLGLDQVYAEDIDFMDDFEKVLSSIKPDMTIFYQLLMDVPLELKDENSMVNHFNDSYYKELQPEERKALYYVLHAYIERIKSNSCSREESIRKMKQANPRFILRNYLLHEAIEELTKGEDTLFRKLQEAIKEPYSDKFDEFFNKRPDWATRQPGCSMLSCSS